MKPEIRIVYIKKGCSKCNTLIQNIESLNVQCEFIEYLYNPLTEEEIISVLQKLNIKASQLVRKNEELYKKKYSGKKRSEKQWINILVKHPELLQRPIVVYGEKAWLARDNEAIELSLKD